MCLKTEQLVLFVLVWLRFYWTGIHFKTLVQTALMSFYGQLMLLLLFLTAECFFLLATMQKIKEADLARFSKSWFSKSLVRLGTPLIDILN